MMYALVVKEKQYPLQVGKNVVGRSSVPVDGVSFINLESPQAAISRMQAFLDVGANGDAWISDCNSTNGTFLSVRPGTGIRLESERYYQLSPGCRIVFGDVECTFEALRHPPGTPPQHHLTPASTSAGPPSRQTERLPSAQATSGAPLSCTDGSGVVAAGTASSSGAARATRKRQSNRGNVPYLDESASESQEQSTAAEAPEEPNNPKRTMSTPSSPPTTAKAAKRAKPEPAAASSAVSATTATAASSQPSSSASTVVAPPVVCLTGMDSDERDAIRKRVRQLKGRVVEDITKANLLVVATPPVRTPKFIIAVARGIPVVSVQYICNEASELADARHHIVGLKTDQHTYSAAALEKVIYRKEHRPLLKGVQVNLAALAAKTRAVATEIVTASGGEVVRGKKTDVLAVTDDKLDALYDSILRGKVPKKL